MTDIVEQLKRHEGTKRNAAGRHVLYRDTSDRQGFEGKSGKLTVCYGRNVDDRGFSEDEAELMLSNDVAMVKAELDQALPWWTMLDEVRRMVLVNLGFNLGVLTGNPPKLLTFAHTLDLIKNRQYADAADRLMTLPWAKQVGARAVELTTMLRTGQFPGEAGS